MLVVTNLAGFGANRRANSDLFFTRTDTDFNTDSPSFSLDLGQIAGTKQVVIAFTMNDNDASDAFTVSATLDGNAMTEIHQAGRFDGSSNTVGASLFRRETTATGIVTVTCPIAGFAGTMDRSTMNAVVMSGYNPVPVDIASADSASSATATLSVTGAALVIVAGSHLTSAPGDLNGFGSKTTFRANNRTSVGYSIVNGTGNKTYSFDNNVNCIVAASFAQA